MSDIHTHAVIVTHGGVGGPKEHSDACERACRAGAAAFMEHGHALEAAIRATIVLEDDPRLNAGTGSNFRLDGKTIEMDAAVMDDAFRFGAVAAIQRVKNPVRVAESVLKTPHLLLAGEGATAFARAQGFPEYDPVSERARKRYEQVRAFFSRGTGGSDHPAWHGVDPASFWNFDDTQATTLRQLAGPSDTVGAVVRDGRGGFAAALSTGGTSIMLRGRIGDTPIIGAGLYAGPHGAVAATGDGEEIMRRVLAKHVYDRIVAGASAQEAADEGIAMFPGRFAVGIIAVSAQSEGIADNRTMPAARLHV
ncbi:MAG TPA: isoaspartyl peptidase/L-asparaginase [Candidatus Eisenbacteria bacterium]|nr:isoaspartyl peptidase/L-asparaginase [Candidatus Eisenbacteria bacterium]